MSNVDRFFQPESCCLVLNVERRPFPLPGLLSSDLDNPSTQAGHRNQRQKVKYLESIKSEMLRLQRDNAALEAELSATKIPVKRLQQRQQGGGGGGGGGRLSSVSSLGGGSRRRSTVSEGGGVGSVLGSGSSSGSGGESAALTPR